MLRGGSVLWGPVFELSVAAVVLCAGGGIFVFSDVGKVYVPRILPLTGLTFSPVLNAKIVRVNAEIHSANVRI